MPPKASSPASPRSGMLLPLGSLWSSKGMLCLWLCFATTLLEQEQWVGARTSCCAILGWPCLGDTSPQLLVAPWAVGAQHLLAVLAAGTERFQSLPRTSPCQC